MLATAASYLPDAVRTSWLVTGACLVALVIALNALLIGVARCRTPSVPRVACASFDEVVAAAANDTLGASKKSGGGLATFDTRAPSKEATAAAATPRPERFDAIVVGGGIIGCAMACALGKQGRRVLMLERDLTEPDRIVGELLQPDGIAKLAELGLQDCVEGIDAPHVRGYSLYFQGKECCVSYPSEERDGVACQPVGRGLHHGRFVTKLRRAAAALPSVTVRQGSVQSLIYRDAQVVGARYDHKAAVHAALIGALHPNTPLAYRVIREDGSRPPVGTPAPPGGASDMSHQDVDHTETALEAFAPLTIVVDGCFSKFRKELTTPDVSAQTNSSFLGVMLHDCKMPFENHGLVCLTDPTPAVIYPVSSNEVRALISFRNRVPPKEELVVYLRERLLPQLPECLRPAMAHAIDNGHMRSMPNQFMSARPRLVPGAALVGDSFNMRHPFTGGGMTCGLTDVVRFSDALAKVPVRAANAGATMSERAAWDDVRALSHAVGEFYAHRQHNVTMNMLSVALFEVCSANVPELRQACFDYLSKGPEYFNGPITLLSGRARSQALLARHFTAVAAFGVVRAALWPCPTPRRLWTALKMIRQAVRAGQ